MSTKFVEPDVSIQEALREAVRRIFKEHFEASNIHPRRLGITYGYKKGEWTASIELNWQRKRDFQSGTRYATFEYVRRDPPDGRERYWYCTSGLPND